MPSDNQQHGQDSLDPLPSWDEVIAMTKKALEQDEERLKHWNPRPLTSRPAVEALRRYRAELEKIGVVFPPDSPLRQILADRE